MKNNDKRNRNNQKGKQSKVASMSILGNVISRDIDVLYDVTAVNSLGQGFYSLGSAATSPVMSLNITNSMVLQFSEYSELVQLYGLAKLTSIEVNFSRASNYIGAANNTILNTPPIFIQVSTIPYTTGTALLQAKVAIADNSEEINLQTNVSRKFKVKMPQCIVSNNRSQNQTFTFGSNVWVSTKLNGIQNFPDIFLNLGSLTGPTFDGTAGSSASYLVGQIHLKLQVDFAGPVVA